MATYLEWILFGWYSRSVVYRPGAHPEDKMAANLGIVTEGERGERLTRKEGTLWTTHQDGSPDLTEVPVMGFIHCFQNGHPCPWLINKI